MTKKFSKRFAASAASAAVLCSAVTFPFVYEPLIPEPLTAEAVVLLEPENKGLSTTSTAPAETTTMTTSTQEIKPPGYDTYIISGIDTITAKDEESITFADNGTFWFILDDYEKKSGTDSWEKKQFAGYNAGDMVEIYLVYGLERYNGVPSLEYVSVHLAELTTSAENSYPYQTTTTAETYIPESTATKSIYLELDYPFNFTDELVSVGENSVTFETYGELMFGGDVSASDFAGFKPGDLINASTFVNFTNGNTLIKIVSLEYAGTVTKTAVTTTEIPATETSIIEIAGDANGDNKISLADSVVILQYIANKDKYPLDSQAIQRADVYNKGDGITPNDALSIQKYDAHIIDFLPETYFELDY